MLLGKYEIGRALGEGNFGKVKYARHVETGKAVAVKILDRKRIQSLKIDDQVSLPLLERTFFSFFSSGAPRSGPLGRLNSVLGLDMERRSLICVQIKREIGTLKLLRHPNVVRLLEVRSILQLFLKSLIIQSFKSRGMMLFYF